MQQLPCCCAAARTWRMRQESYGCVLLEESYASVLLRRCAQLYLEPAAHLKHARAGQKKTVNKQVQKQKSYALSGSDSALLRAAQTKNPRISQRTIFFFWQASLT